MVGQIPGHGSELYGLALAFVDMFISSYERAPEVIILDIDDTDDEVHGGQQRSLFNGHYDEHCYMPLHIYEGRSGKLITTITCGRLPLYLPLQHQKITNSWM